MNRRVATIGLLMLMSACRSEKAIFMLGDQRYYRPEFEDFLQYMVDPEEPYASGDEVLSRMLDRFIDQKVFEAAIKEKNLKLEPSELEQAQSRLHVGEAGVPVSDPLKQRLTLDLLKDRFIRQFLAANVSVSPEEIAAYYQAHQEEYRMPERFSAREIMLHDREEAERTRQQLRGKDARHFAEVAQRVSKGMNAAQGGEMGVRRRGQLPSEMEVAILRLKVGEISPVVQTPYGFHVFMLEALLPPEDLTLDAMKDSIQTEILQEKIRNRVEVFLRQKRETLPLKIFKNNLGFEYVEEEEVNR